MSLFSRLLCVTVAAAGVLLAGASPAWAILKFQKAFYDEYLVDHGDQEFATFVRRKVKCYLCHQGKDRQHNNVYGAALTELLDHKQDKDDVEKIVAALRAVADLPSDPSNPASPTFGQLIAGSKLPAGELEELKKEPDELASP